MCLYEVFTHTVNGAIRHGNFKMVKDYEQYEDMFSNAENVLDSCTDPQFIAYEDDSCYPDTMDCWFGTGYHIGHGVYQDDDGDNWDFF